MSSENSERSRIEIRSHFSPSHKLHLFSSGNWANCLLFSAAVDYKGISCLSYNCSHSRGSKRTCSFRHTVSPFAGRSRVFLDERRVERFIVLRKREKRHESRANAQNYIIARRPRRASAVQRLSRIKVEKYPWWLVVLPAPSRGTLMNGQSQFAAALKSRGI